MIVELKGMTFDTLDVDDLAEIMRLKAANIKMHMPPQVFIDCADILEQMLQMIVEGYRI